MSEAFSVSGEYKLTSNAVDVLRGITRGFQEALAEGDRLRELLDRLGGMGDRLSGLTGQIRALGRVRFDGLAGSIGSASGELDALTKSADAARQALEQAKGASKDFGRGTRPASDALQDGAGQGSSNRPRQAEPLTMGRALHNAMTLGIDAQMYGGVLEAAFNPAMTLAQTRQRLIAMGGGSTVDADAAISQAKYLQTVTPGTDLPGNLTAYSMLARLTQNPAEARALLPSFLPIGVAAASFHPESGDYAHQLESLMQLAEFRGALVSTDPKTGQQTVNTTGAQSLGRMLLGAEVATLGGTDFRGVLNFSRSAGTAGANIDSSEIPYLIPIMQAMGDRRAGTGLQGFEQQFSAGRMSEAGANMLIEMGLIRGGGDAKSNPNLISRGMGNYQMLPSALAQGQFETIAFHPREFIQKTLLPLADRQLAHDYGSRFTKADPQTRRVYEANEMTTLASRIPGGTLMGEVIRTLVLGQRDALATQKAQGAPITTIMNQSPSVQLGSLSGGIDHLMATLGGAPFKSGMSALAQLTNALNFTNRVADKHPTAAQAVGHAGGDLVGGAVVGGLINWGSRALARLFPGGFVARGATAVTGATGMRTLAPLAAGAVLYDLLDPIADRIQARWEQNSPTLKRMDDWLQRHTGIGGTEHALTVNLNLDGKQLTSAVIPGVTAHINQQSRQAATATTGRWDPTQHPPLPNASPAH